MLIGQHIFSDRQNRGFFKPHVLQVEGYILLARLHKSRPARLAQKFPRQQLVLEVTESLAAQDQAVQQTLREIRALGVGLALDDFGTGYSSLSCLHELPVDTVKMDRSFVSQAGQSEYHRVLIDATLRMARALGLGTVAEGIETPEQAALMLAMGCERGQGYWFSRPMDTQALVAWIQAGGVSAPAPT